RLSLCRRNPARGRASASWLRKADLLIGSPGTVRVATGIGSLCPTEKSLIAVSPPTRAEARAQATEGCEILPGPREFYAILRRSQGYSGTLKTTTPRSSTTEM